MLNDKIKNSIIEMISLTPLTVLDVSVDCNESDGTYWCRVKTNEPRFFIGKDGENLQALNYLARKVIERSLFNKDETSARPEFRMILDVNDYQKNKIDNLKTLAHMMAERARFFRSNMEIDPMPAGERRIIHEFLAGKPNIITESAGLEPKRRVVIKYIE